MSAYRAPVREMRFVLDELAGLADVCALPGNEDALLVTDDILAEAAAFASGVLDPINQSGDREGCHWRDGEVQTPAGFREAYARFAQAGWIGLTVAEEHGGQGLPHLLAAPVLEMWHAANVGFANAPLLNAAAIEAIELCGSAAQKARYIPKLVSGQWMGTMCLTEPQAGSDLGAVRAKAIESGGRYKVSGQKIFITFGEHDWAENILHLVLARLPDAPVGSKGISLFIVPKYEVRDDGSLGDRNDVICAGIEHKLGLNANPTCTLNYGERGGALAELVGEPNRGLQYMFVMMNAARFAVGVQAYAIADRAYQRALAYALERVQSRDSLDRGSASVPIIEHPDVRRMLMLCKSQLEAMRAVAFVTAAWLDLARAHPDEMTRSKYRLQSELMTPVVKGWCSETAQEITSVALQVFGGLGYVEETGVAQHYRDVRVTTIYEGTTGIQALDLLTRKVIKDGGAVARALLDEMRETGIAIARSGDLRVRGVALRLSVALEALNDATIWLCRTGRENARDAYGVSVPYLRLWGIVCGGFQLARAALAAFSRLQAEGPDEFLSAKIATAHFYADHVLVQAAALREEIVRGGPSVTGLQNAQF